MLKFVKFTDVIIAFKLSSSLSLIFKELISNLIYVFLTGNKFNGFKSLKPKILISNEYGIVSE